MKRIFTLISAIAVGMATMIASTLSDIKSEIAKLEGVTVIDASDDAHAQEYSIKNCVVIMLTPEIIDKVKPILSKIPDDMIFADVNDDDGTKVTVWEEPEDGSANGELLIFVNTEDQLLLVYTKGNLKEMEAGIHVD